MSAHVSAPDADRHELKGASTQAAGAVPYCAAADATTWLAAGSTDDVFTMGSGPAAPQWTTVAGDITGPLSAVTVTDLTISGEAQGAVLYYNGSNWVQLAPGTSGWFLKTQGAAANPIWAAAAGGGGDMQDAYDSDPAILIASATPFPLTHTTTTAATNYAVTLGYSAVAYTGTPHAIHIDWTAATSLNNGGDVYGLNMTGETNAGAGESVALNIDSGWDSGIEAAAKVAFTAGNFTFTGNNFDLDPTGNFTCSMDAARAVQFTLSATLANAFACADASANDYIVCDTSAVAVVLGNATTNPDFKFLGSGEFWDSTGSPGSSTNVWTSNGAGLAPSWQAGGGGGLPHTITAAASTVIVDEAATGNYIKAFDNTGTEKLELMGNDVSRSVHIGPAGTTVVVNPGIYFNDGTGAATRQGRVFYDGSDVFKITLNGGVACLVISEGNDSTSIGAAATAASNSFAAGKNSTASGDISVAIGFNANTDSGCIQSYILSYNGTMSSTADRSIHIGALPAATLTGADSISFGEGISQTHDVVFLVGRDCASTAANQAVWGAGSFGFNDFWLGQGVTHTSAPTGVTVHATGGSGTNIAGGPLTMAGGTASDTGAPGGALALQVAKTNTLSNRLLIPASLPWELTYNPDVTPPHKIFDNTTQTTTGAAKTIITIPTTSNVDGLFVVRAIGINGDTVNTYMAMVKFENGAGTVADIDVLELGKTEDDGTWGGITGLASGSNLLIQITGVASQTIEWRAWGELMQHS